MMEGDSLLEIVKTIGKDFVALTKLDKKNEINS